MAGVIHIIGAGLAGLAAALRLCRQGRAVRLYEAAGEAGGRCRSYFDAELGRRLDNGNHLLVSGNLAAMAYIGESGASATFLPAERADFPFLDLSTGARWRLRPTEGSFPWWLFLPWRSIPGARPWDYLAAYRLARAPAEASVADCLDRSSSLYRHLWRPLCVAALNTEPEAASARLLGRLFLDMFGKGGATLHPILPRSGLSESLVDPAIATITAKGGTILHSHRLRALAMAGDGRSLAALDFGKRRVELAPEDHVLLAVPAAVAADLLPGLTAPNEFRAILNAHFAVADPPGPVPSFLGLVGGLAEWIFLKPGIIAITTSAADGKLDLPAEELIQTLWRDVAAAYALDLAKIPPCRLVKEKRATFAATPAQLARRPGNGTPWRNLHLAGDWTETGWPATIEGAIRSGFAAAAAIADR